MKQFGCKAYRHIPVRIRHLESTVAGKREILNMNVQSCIACYMEMFLFCSDRRIRIDTVVKMSLPVFLERMFLFPEQ